ncbi:VanZ family protein [Chondrinema litorale]|uniref:VanZ family protein n=1 Tax=Chondrinema litorale TaxID=2994555 RepID=UPI002543EE1C|nr:VanZ family protein [Chondrinema litorale]UZR94950.1 VanZ family protein [Chondrinema litorale]
MIKNYMPAFFWLILIIYLLFFFEPSGNGGHIPHFDKVVHGVLFGTLSFLLSFAFYRDFRFQKRKNIFIVLFSIILFLAIITELIQYFFVPRRTGDLIDTMADLTGAFLGYNFYLFIIKKSSLSVKKYLLSN